MTTLIWLLAAGAPLQTPPPPGPEAVGQAYFLFVEGRSLEGRGDVDGAVRAFREAIALVPAAAEIRAELAALYARQGRAVEAVSTAREALQIDAGNREAHRILGFVQAALSDRTGDEALRDEALRHFEQARQARVRDPAAELTLGRLYVRSGRFEPAVRTLTTFLLDQPGYPEAMDLLAQAYEGRGQPLEAAALYRELARTEPGAPAFPMREAMALADAGDVGGAERVLRGIIARDPRQGDALNFLGYLFADRGERLDEALELINRALEVDRGNPSYLDSLGWVRLRRGEFGPAREPLERAAAALPRTSVVQDHLGDLYFAVKEYRAAADAFDRALAGDRRGIDVAAVTRKRDRARELAGR